MFVKVFVLSLSLIRCALPMARMAASAPCAPHHSSRAICSHACPDDTQKRRRGENHNIIINMVMETTTKSQFIRDLL